MSLLPEPGSSTDARVALVLYKIFIASGTAGLASLVPAPIAAALGSGALQVVERVGERWGQRGLTQAATVAKLALDESGLAADEFAARIAAERHLDHLAAKVFEASADSTSETQLRILGKVLANATTHPETIDDELLIAVALRPLEQPHFRMLGALREAPPQSEEPTKPALKHWSVAGLRSRLGWQNPSVISTLLTLQASGLVYLSNTARDEGRATYGFLGAAGTHVDLSSYVCELTDFGLQILERADAASDLEA